MTRRNLPQAQSGVTKTKSQPLTLKDVLSRLSFSQAIRILGPQGREMLKSGSVQTTFLSDSSNFDLTDDKFEIVIYGTRVTFYLAGPKGILSFCCSSCHQEMPLGCNHVASALSLILEEKVVLGLAAPPPERVPLERLSEEALVERAISERKEKVHAENLTVTGHPPKSVWGDYQVDNPKSGRSYRVSLRGWEKGKSFCECPDFKVNTLGLCKHTLAVMNYLEQRGKNLKKAKPWEPTEIEVYLDYTVRPAALRLQTPAFMADKTLKLLKPFFNQPITDVLALVKTVAVLDDLGEEPVIFPDALEHIELALHRIKIKKITEEIRKDPANHPLRQNLLKVDLLPYQLDGLAFAAGAGRAILADDMGLGKTIQGVGLAELLAKYSGIKKVLIICPASLKSQWQNEIRRFCDRSVSLVLGQAHLRRLQYSGQTFFTICNYEQVMRDRAVAKLTDWDLIILDEAQKIKNWETSSHRAVAELKSRYFLILTGTPLENSLDELYTLVKLVDDQLLGPAFRFLNAHKQTDERGKLMAWQGLNEIKAALAPVFLRRTRAQVMTELPPRQVDIFPVAATEEQLELHNHYMKMVNRIIKKPFLTEMDLLRLKKFLLMSRLAANSTALVDKELPGKSGKMKSFEALIERLLAEEDRKIIVFSEWTGMLNLVENCLKSFEATWVRLDGSVPQTKRQALIRQFTDDLQTRLFLCTNAGSVGLNLQAADTVINLDLPWNPAILEQRIGRAHRMGQTKPVQVFLLVTKETIEERLLDLLGAKSALALAALDQDSDVDLVEMTTGVDALKERLEILLGRRPDKPVEEVSTDPHFPDRRQRVLSVGEKLKSAAIELLEILAESAGVRGGSSESDGNNLPDQTQSGADIPDKPGPGQILGGLLANFTEKDSQGRSRLVLPMPDETLIEKVVGSIGQLLGNFFPRNSQ
ncbi:MAG: DEAD/DEAH box helicase [Deltaproteobacteria bacterium]|jgi:superfamily II DNA or RNA helicase|nr:DEAD/DEAH box helicase [Deltaproteobacteria bacterium]